MEAHHGNTLRHEASERSVAGRINALMLTRLSKYVTATGVAAALAVGAVPKPAAASTQSTINTALGAAALIGGLVLYNNYQHKKQAANAVVGYTRNGGTVYGDGRIVMANGQTIYPNSNGQYPWGQTAYYNQNANGYAYDTQRTGRYDNTHRHANGYVNGNGYANGNAYVNGKRYGNANTMSNHGRPPAQAPAYGARRGNRHGENNGDQHQ
jgi:hypothetical protein